MRIQIILQVQNSDQSGLSHQGKTHYRTDSVPPDVRILRKRIGRQSVLQNDLLLGPDDITQNGFREFNDGSAVVEKNDLDSVGLSGGFCPDLQVSPLRKEQKASYCTRVFDHRDHYCFDQLIQDDLT